MAKKNKIEEVVEETTQEVSAETTEEKIIEETKLEVNVEVSEVSAEVQEEIIPEETIISEDVVAAKDEFINEPVEEIKLEQQKEQVGEFWNKVEKVIDEPSPVIEFANEPIEIKIDVKPKRTLDSLSKGEYKDYQRTGRMPE